MFKYNVGLKTLLQKSLPEPELYGDFVYKFRKIMLLPKPFIPYNLKGKKDCLPLQKDVTTWLFCDKLQTWLLTQLWLIALLYSLIAWRMVGPHTKSRLPP